MAEVATQGCSADDSMVQASDGRCAAYTSDLVEYLSFAGSHCNAWLFALANSCTTYDPSLMHPSLADSAEMGPIDTDRIIGRDPALRSAVASGMKWRVVHASLASVHGFVEWAQSALNTEASQGINELECFRSASPDQVVGIQVADVFREYFLLYGVISHPGLRVRSSVGNNNYDQFANML